MHMITRQGMLFQVGYFAVSYREGHRYEQMICG